MQSCPQYGAPLLHPPFLWAAERLKSSSSVLCCYMLLRMNNRDMEMYQTEQMSWMTQLRRSWHCAARMDTATVSSDAMFIGFSSQFFMTLYAFIFSLVVTFRTKIQRDFIFVETEIAIIKLVVPLFSCLCTGQYITFDADYVTQWWPPSLHAQETWTTYFPFSASRTADFNLISGPLMEYRPPEQPFWENNYIRICRQHRTTKGKPMQTSTNFL